MKTFVLVGGTWIGGWCWQGVACRLRARGHDVYPVALTELGERVHRARTLPARDARRRRPAGRRPVRPGPGGLGSTTFQV